MYSYTWDAETGGLLLNSSPLSFSKEPRPVYYKELDILGFDRYWNYAKNDSYPYMWAEANNYFYRGRQVAKTKGGSLYTPPEIVIMDEPEPDGQPLRFVDIPAMVEKNRDLLEKLAAETIKKIYNIYVEYMDRVDVFYVAFSGGKDSVVALDLVQRALPHNKFKVLFGDTGMEFPDTYKIVEEIEQHCKDAKIEFLRAKSDFDPKVTWREFGPPAQTMRWCCSVHKTAPQIILLREYTNNPHFRGMAFTGIRGDESASRSEYEGISHGEKVRGQYSCHPILEWNSAELFSYIYERQLLINDAYKKGNSRAGCLVCPLATSKNMYFKEQAYSFSDEGYRTTTTFNNIILETTSKELSNPSAVKEFMDIGGWKARRSGKELSFAKSYTNESFEQGVLTIQVSRIETDWKQWIKTIAAFGAVNRAKADEQAIDRAMEYFASAKFFDLLDDSAALDKAFRDSIIGNYAVMLLNIQEVKDYLDSHITAEPFEWFGLPEIEKKLRQMAEAKYNQGGCERALAKIDEMDIADVKKYLKDLIRDNMVVGMEIIKGN